MDHIQTLLNSENTLGFLLVLVALMWFFNQAGQTIETWKKLRKPKEAEDEEMENRIKSCERRFSSDQRRLDEHEKKIEDLQAGMRHNCFGVKALLNHELHNGNADEMSKAASDIDAYLINR